MIWDGDGYYQEYLFYDGLPNQEWEDSTDHTFDPLWRANSLLENMLCDIHVYHTHHYLCQHAIGDSFEYIEEAIKNNFSEIGISDHGPINAEAFSRMSINQFYNVYLKELNLAIEQYKDKIKIYKGLEIEYVYDDLDYYNKLLEDLDYLILGPHYYEGERILHPYSTYTVNTHDKLARYTKYIVDALDSKLFRILAHPDLFLHGYHQLDSFGEECVRKICEAAERNNCLLEFNAGGIRSNNSFDENGNPKYRVPNHEFWKVVETTNVKVIINSDCHKPSELNDEAFQLANELAKKYKLNIVKRLFE